MEFFITSDSWEQTKASEVVSAFNELGVKRFFAGQNYGGSIVSIGIVLMCREPDHKFKQRIKFSDKGKRLSLDIMLDYNQFISNDQKTRNRIVAEKLINEVPIIIAKYKFKDFNLLLFESHLREWMRKLMEKKHDISTSPRSPILGELNVSITGMDNDERATVNIIDDETGKVLTTIESSSSLIKIDTTNYPDAIYTINVLVGQDQLYTKVLKGISRRRVMNPRSKL